MSGKTAILLIFVVALAASAGAYAYNRSMQRKAIEFWGAEQALVIARADKITAMKIRESNMAEAPLALAGRRFEAVQSRNVYGARGFSHVRHALLNSGSFDWSAAAPASPNWSHALQFTFEKQSVVVFFDESTAAIAAEGTRVVVATPLQRGLNDFLRQEFETADAVR